MLIYYYVFKSGLVICLVFYKTAIFTKFKPTNLISMLTKEPPSQILDLA
jgi:hypothetical protein